MKKGKKVVEGYSWGDWENEFLWREQSLSGLARLDFPIIFNKITEPNKKWEKKVRITIEEISI